MGSCQYWAGRVYNLSVYFMTETSEGSTESGFMEKPGMEPATPGLQDKGSSPTPRRLHPRSSAAPVPAGWAHVSYGSMSRNSRRLKK